MFTKKRCCLIVILFLTFSYSSNIDTSLYFSFLDINGDKIVDTLELKKIKEIKYPPTECVLLNLWNKEDKFISDTQIVINLLISTGKGNRHKRYIIYNKFFFSSPIWQSRKPPISVLKYNKKREVESSCNLSPRGDIIVLGTESGIDIYIFFDGKNITLCEPDEVP